MATMGRIETRSSAMVITLSFAKLAHVCLARRCRNCHAVAVTWRELRGCSRGCVLDTEECVPVDERWRKMLATVTRWSRTQPFVQCSTAAVSPFSGAAHRGELAAASTAFAETRRDPGRELLERRIGQQLLESAGSRCVDMAD